MSFQQKTWQEIKELCSKSHASLLAVSKAKNVDDILPLIHLGQRYFGENRVQESLKKWPTLKKNYPDIKLHLIGPLQTNKVKEAVTLFDGIQTLDRPKLAIALRNEFERQEKTIPLMIQVNIGKEPQKSGVAVEELSDFINYCRQALNLSLIGLMAIPPAHQDPKSYFMQLKELADQHDLKEVSMGMSNDYLEALACGSTIIRIGTRLFEER